MTRGWQDGNPEPDVGRLSTGRARVQAKDWKDWPPTEGSRASLSRAACRAITVDGHELTGR